MLIFINMTPTLLSKLPKVGDFFIKNNNKELVVKSFPVVTINYGIGGKIIEKTYRLNRIDLKTRRRNLKKIQFWKSEN